MVPGFIQMDSLKYMKSERAINIEAGAIWKDIIDVIHCWLSLSLEKWGTGKHKSLLYNLIPLTPRTVRNTSFSAFNHNNTNYLKTWTVYVEKKAKTATIVCFCLNEKPSFFVSRFCQ